MTFRTDYSDYLSFDKLEGEVRNHEKRFDQVMSYLFDHNQRLGTVLDVGGGTGLLGRKLLSRGYKFPVLITDVNNLYLDRLRSEYGLNAIFGDVRKLPFKDREFDIVTCTEVLEHLSNPGEGLKELVRVAKDRVIITLPRNGAEDDWHGWRVKADVVDNWVVIELARRVGNE